MSEQQPRKPFRKRVAEKVRHTMSEISESLRTAEHRRIVAALESTPPRSKWVILEFVGNDAMATRMNQGWEIVSHSPPYDDDSRNRYMMRKRRKALARELTVK